MTDFIAIHAQSSGTYRVEKLSGVDYIVVPVVALVQGVLQGVTGEQPELALASEFGRFPTAWNGRPITIDHPYIMEGDEIIRVSASQSPDVLEDFQVGFIFNTKMDVTGTKLQMEAWIDPVKANNHSDAARTLLSKIRKGETIEVSTGLFTGSERSEGTYGDRQYFGIWRGVVPDHLALLPDGLIGACSNADGCGVYANRAGSGPLDQGLIRVHALKTQCNCGGQCMSGKPNASGTAPSPGGTTTQPKSPLPNSSTSTVAQLSAFDPQKFIANMIPDGMLDNDIRMLLQNAIEDKYPGAYAYLVGFTSDSAVFSMYSSLDSSRDTYQVSYDIDEQSKEVVFADDLACVVLTTSITVMPDDDDDGPISPMDLAAYTKKGKNKKPKMQGSDSAVSETAPQADPEGDDDEQTDAAGVPVKSNSSTATTENPMTTSKTTATGTPVAITAAEARTFLTDFGYTADSLKAIADDKVLKIHATIKAGMEKHAPKPEATTAAVTTTPSTTPSEPVVANSTTQSTKPMTQEEYLALAPPGVRESIEAGIRMHTNHKANLVKAILANSRNKFTEAQLNGFDVPTLENLSELAVVPDYSGVAPAGGGIHAHTQQITANEGDSQFAAAPPRLGMQTQENRGVMKGAA